MRFVQGLRQWSNMFGVAALGRQAPKDASPELESFLRKHDNGRGPMNRRGDGRFGWGEVTKTNPYGIELKQDLEKLPLDERIWVEKGISDGASMLFGFTGYQWKRFTEG